MRFAVTYNNSYQKDIIEIENISQMQVDIRAYVLIGKNPEE